MNQLINDIGNMSPVDVPQILPLTDTPIDMANPNLINPILTTTALPPLYTPLCLIGDKNCYNNKFFTDLLYSSPHKFVMVGNNPILNVGGFYYKKFGINNNVYIVRSPHQQLQLTPQDQFVIITNNDKTVKKDNSIKGDVPVTFLSPTVKLMPVPQNFINRARILPTQDLVMFSKYMKYKNKYYKLKQSS